MNEPHHNRGPLWTWATYANGILITVHESEPKQQVFIHENDLQEMKTHLQLMQHHHPDKRHSYETER